MSLTPQHHPLFMPWSELSFSGPRPSSLYNALGDERPCGRGQASWNNGADINGATLRYPVVLQPIPVRAQASSVILLREVEGWMSEDNIDEDGGGDMDEDSELNEDGIDEDSELSEDDMDGDNADNTAPDPPTYQRLERKLIPIPQDIHALFETLQAQTPYICACGLPFVYKSNMTTHQKRKISPYCALGYRIVKVKEPFECPWCDLPRKKDWRRLKEHLENVHCLVVVKLDDPDIPGAALEVWHYLPDTVQPKSSNLGLVAG
ncbi:hypothetical protein NMY22_g15721 [Coprinellus aureogranulatus]|nr:hypothetical protein NMY22_g15721 [Coprinellus aureogranulatus]